MVETINRFQQVRRRLLQDLGRDPTVEELAAVTLVTIIEIVFQDFLPKIEYLCFISPHYSKKRVLAPS
jgi:DNA-directed RNA polymerase specialized sigma subunit